MCFPYNSSTRRNEIKAVYGPTELKNWMKYGTISYQPVKYTQWNDIVKDILDNIH